MGAMERVFPRLLKSLCSHVFVQCYQRCSHLAIVRLSCPFRANVTESLAPDVMVIGCRRPNPGQLGKPESPV